MAERPKLITTHDLASWLQMDPSTVSKWVDKGLLLAFRTPGGHRRIRAHDAIEFLQKHGMPLPAELAGGEMPPPAVERRTATRARLLLLDDVYWVEKSKAALEDVFTLSVTTSPLEAMLLIAEQRPGFVLVELNLKGIAGVEVVRTIREHESLKGVRVATMTALPSKIAERKSKDAGAQACFAKPLQAEQVRAAFGQSAAVRA